MDTKSMWMNNKLKEFYPKKKKDYSRRFYMQSTNIQTYNHYTCRTVHSETFQNKSQN